MIPNEREDLRGAYMAFRFGARLTRQDVARLLAPLGLSNNRLRELGRDSDRGDPIRPAEFRALLSAWAAEVRPQDNRAFTETSSQRPPTAG